MRQVMFYSDLKSKELILATVFYNRELEKENWVYHQMPADQKLKLALYLLHMTGEL